MSCDGNRHKYFEHLARQPDIQKALGLEGAQAVFALERLYQVGQSAGVLKTSRSEADESELAVETEMTRRLFARMQALGIKPPAHSADGLPKKPARFGYGQIERILDAIEKGAPMPEAMTSIAGKVARGAYPRSPGLQRMAVAASGAVSAVGFDPGGYYRCSNCGRFASRANGHVCPMTATSSDLKRMLTRRIRLPASAFDGYQMDALNGILEDARSNGGEIVMLHTLTGRRERVTLDGIPQALMSGFIPKSWDGLAVPVITDNLNVVGVLNASGLERAVEHISAVHTLAHYYGLQIPPDAPVMNAYQAVTNRSPLHQIGIQQGAVGLDGGQVYDLGHFIGTEFRKNEARGTFVEIGGRRYGIYARSRDPNDKSSARGRFATDASEIVVGRTLPAAIGILAEGGVSEADGKVEVYDRNGNLLSVYDPSTNTVGDTIGNPNASAEQMAAVLAHRFLNPSNAFDYALIQDFLAFKGGSGSPIAVADSGYLAVRSMLESGHVLQMGARLSIGRCPQCGQFIGQGAHACPAQGASVSESKPKRRSKPVQAASEAQQEQTPVTPGTEAASEVPVVPSSPDPAQIHPASVQVTVALPDTFADDLGNIVADILNAKPEGSPITASRSYDKYDQILMQLADLLATQQKTLDKLAQAQTGSGVDAEKLSDTIARAVARSMPAPMIVSDGEGGAVVARARRCPRCGQGMEQDHQCPPRMERKGLQRPDIPLTEPERIFDGILMPAPDLYLDRVPSEWGGNLAVPLPENTAELVAEYEMGPQERAIYNMMALQFRKKSRKPTNRAFGLYGPAGTGKNTIARMVAASLKCDDGKQGLPYYEVNITPDVDINTMIGEVVLTTDEEGRTVSRVRLGPIGVTAASGGVVAINEIVRSPKLATALQSIIEDGEISVPTPEGGTYKIPVHPSAIFITTWNPGYEGDADRPAQAFLSRITALPLEYPGKDEQIRRLKGYFEREGLDTPSDEILDASVGFWNDLRLLTGATGQAPQVGVFSPTRTTPGPRELARFVEYGVRSSWEDALKTLEIICDQDAEYRETQKNILHDRFEAHFGGLV